MNFSPVLNVTMLMSWLLKIAVCLSTSNVGITFSPAGLLTPFHLGVASSLRDHGLISTETALAGSSGGAIVACTEALSMDVEQVLDACTQVAIECRNRGTFRTLASALNSQLVRLIPENSCDILSMRKADLIIAYQKIWPKVEAVNQKRFASKQDLVKAVEASCTIPMYFSGLPFSTLLDESLAIDGYFTTNANRFGCPCTNREVEIAVCPFDHLTVGLTSNSLVISPRLLVDRYGNSDFYSDYYSTLQLAQLALAPPQKRDLREGSTGGLVSAGPCTDAEISQVYHTIFKAGIRSTEIFLESSQIYCNK